MTVVSAMKFNDTQGAIISDERVSGYGRQDDLVSKLMVYNIPEKKLNVIMGVSGAADVIQSIKPDFADVISKYSDSMNSKGEVIDAFNSITARVVNKIRSGYLYKQFGIRQEDFQVGYTIDANNQKAPIDSLLKEKYNNVLEGRNNNFNSLTNNLFLFIADDPSGLELYTMHMMHPIQMPTSKQYVTIGSGADKADSVLSDYMEDLNREQRNDIDATDGVTELVYATYRAAKKNQGVGGIPHIGYLDRGQVFIIGEKESHLTTQIVAASKKDLIPDEFRQEAIFSLVLHDQQSYNTVNPEFWKSSKDPEKMREFLMGYK